MIKLEHQKIVEDFNGNSLHYYVFFEMQLLEFYRLTSETVQNSVAIEENLVRQYAFWEAVQLVNTAPTREKLANIEQKILGFFIEQKTQFLEQTMSPEISLYMRNKYGRLIDSQQVVDKQTIQAMLVRHDEQGKIAQYLNEHAQFVRQWPFELLAIAEENSMIAEPYIKALHYILTSLHAADLAHIPRLCERIHREIQVDDAFYSEDVRALTRLLGAKGTASLLLDALAMHRFIVTDDVLQKALFQLVSILGLMKTDVENIIGMTNALKVGQYEQAENMLPRLAKFPQASTYVKHYYKYGGDQYRPLQKVLVIGTMSSGKSTLLNGIIGKDLFPSKNEACTAKIFEYSCRTDLACYYVKPDATQDYERYELLSEESFAQWNRRDELQHIQIQGPITSVYRFSKKLVFMDTPGPNNSMDESHSEMMEKALLLPVHKIVYIINATQLATDDDRLLLVKIAEHLKKHPQQQILFIVNKVDEFDNNENESLQTLKDNVYAYLRANGFDEPDVVFTSALACKLVLKQLAGETLTRRERNLLTFYEEFFITHGINFEQLSTPISVHAQNTVRYQLPVVTTEQAALAEKIIQHSGLLHALRSI